MQQRIDVLYPRNKKFSSTMALEQLPQVCRKGFEPTACYLRKAAISVHANYT